MFSYASKSCIAKALDYPCTKGAVPWFARLEKIPMTWSPIDGNEFSDSEYDPKGF